MSLFKLARIVILLSILFGILVSAWMTERRMASWDRPILVTVYPIAADPDPATVSYASRISPQSFQPVNEFFSRASSPYGITLAPAFRFQVAPLSSELPPPLPQRHNVAAIAWWSLRMRWWALVQDFNDSLIQPDIQMFVLYRSLGDSGHSGDSVGMRKGRYSIVKAYGRASLRSRNLVVFTHELMHVLGASDKYALGNGEPLFPEGYADPDQRPLFPQTRAEIMGGRIPLDASTSVMPASLDDCRIGIETAREIGFYDQLLP